MKLCWLIPDDRGGGVASVALSCVRQAQAAGHEATLLLVLPPTGWLKGEDRAGFVLDSLHLEPPAADTPAVLLHWLETHPQDVLVLNGCEQADLVIPYLPVNVRCVYAVHDTAARYWQRAVRHEVDLDGIVAVSHTVADEFRPSLKKPSKLRVIHNGSFFPPAAEDSSNRPDDVLFLGGDNLSKGALDLLHLWRLLLHEGFKGDLHWLGQMDEGFARRVRALPAAGRVHLRGRMSRAEVFDAAARSRVFLMLSRAEAFGMATVEAMSMGCVPVAWDLAIGTREIVRDGESGLFAPLGDFVALAAQVRQASVDYTRLGPTATQEARSHFSEEAMWQGYAQMFNAITCQPPQTRSFSGQPPPSYVPPRRFFQLLPEPARRAVRRLIGASPRLGYWLRNQRGW